MSAEAFIGFLSSLKQTSPIIFMGLAMACGIVLFSNEGLISIIGLNEFREANKSYIGWGFVLPICIVFAQSIPVLLSFVKAQMARWQTVKWMKGSLANLTRDEKAYLAPYILEGKTTQKFYMGDGVLCSLVAGGILYQASGLGNLNYRWDYNLQPWARERLQKNPKLLE